MVCLHCGFLENKPHFHNVIFIGTVAHPRPFISEVAAYTRRGRMITPRQARGYREVACPPRRQ